jgi:6,7-dimethyl-8-ribityllumazine synthase
MAKDKKKKSGKLAIVASRFNKEITDGLLSGALEVLTANGYEEKDIPVIYCPGAFEIPLTAKRLCESGKYCGIICLGAVIKGETAHFEYISQAVTQGIAELNLEFDIPVSFGVLTCYTD